MGYSSPSPSPFTRGLWDEASFRPSEMLRKSPSDSALIPFLT